MEDLEDADEYDGDEGDIRTILRNIQAPVDSYKEKREAAQRRSQLEQHQIHKYKHFIYVVHYTSSDDRHDGFFFT